MVATQAEIREVCDQIVEKFHPEKVILFGSYAYGEPTVDSDVDLLVIMPVEPGVRQSLVIRLAIEHAFPLDLLVKTPEELERRYQGYDPLIRYALDKGKTLYDRALGIGKRPEPARNRSRVAS